MAARPDNIIPFPLTATTPIETATGDTSSPTYRKITAERIHVQSPDDDQAEISIDDLYPSTEAITFELDTALRLLAKGLEFVNQASEAVRDGEKIEGDDAMQRLQALLPELFNCRALGDGYGAIINAVLGALENMRGSRLNQQQILSIRRVLQRVRTEPFITFHSALDEIQKLEEAKFVIEPVGFEYLADWLDESG